MAHVKRWRNRVCETEAYGGAHYAAALWIYTNHCRGHRVRLW